MDKINDKLAGFNFVLLGGDDGKKPIEKGWQNKIYKINDPILQAHINAGKNYGVQSNNSSVVIDGKSNFLVIVDFDTKEFQDKVIELLPETFTTTSGSLKQCYHLWFASDNNKAFKIKDENLNTLADVIGAGNQVVAPGSKHLKSGSTYSIVKDIPIAFINYAELEAILMPYDKSPKKIAKEKKIFIKGDTSGDLTEKLLGSVSMEQVLEEVGVDTSKNPTDCPFHNSVGGKCLGFNAETAHCFHCDSSWNKFSMVRDAKKKSDKETFEWFAEKSGLSEELHNSRKEYKKKEELDDNAVKTTTGEYIAHPLTRRGQIEDFWKTQPFFYDEHRIFWEWERETFRWVKSNEVNFLNAIFKKLGVDTLDSKTYGEFIRGFQQVGRMHKPKNIEKTWVQYLDRIYDGKTGLEVCKSSPEWFATNPIPWKVGNGEETPTIDKLFDDWIKGQDLSWKETLYEIIAYNTTQNKFMQRLFALCGGGSNGKGTYIKINQRFLGENNYTASEIKTISEDRFGAAGLYKKLLCIMGEIGYDDLTNTNQLKKLGGEDTLSFQFKGKDSFPEENTATCICLTNALPTTPDKSMGFYRKWLIVDFLNVFPQIKENIVRNIPNIEFENLAKKSLSILKKLYSRQEFTNEGTFEEREIRYENRSNPVEQFVNDYCEEVAGAVFPLRDFTRRLNEELKSRHLRIMNTTQVGKALRKQSFIVGARKIQDITTMSVLNLGLKRELPSEPLKPSISDIALYKEPISKHDGNDGSNGNYKDLEGFY